MLTPKEEAKSNSLQRVINHYGVKDSQYLVLEYYFGANPSMYAIRLKDLAKPLKGFGSTHTAGKVKTTIVWISVVFLIILSGVVYRTLASHLQIVDDTPINLPMSLSSFPTNICNWIGMELDISNTTKQYIEKHFADDFISRRYNNSATKAWVDVYIVYCSSKPGSILGHQPRVCYPAHGWVHDSTEPSQFISRNGRPIPCLIHRFHKPAPMYEQTIVMNFYILNGQITTDERDFSSPFSRRPNLVRDPARYVAQVQISSVLENSVRTAAKDITDLIFDFLPDENSNVKAEKDANTTSGILK